MLRAPFWEWEIPMGWITEAQTNGALEQINLLNGRRLPVLFIMNPASTNLGRDSIFGLIQESSPVEFIQAFDTAGGMMSSTSFPRRAAALRKPNGFQDRRYGQRP